MRSRLALLAALVASAASAQDAALFADAGPALTALAAEVPVPASAPVSALSPVPDEAPSDSVASPPEASPEAAALDPADADSAAAPAASGVVAPPALVGWSLAEALDLDGAFDLGAPLDPAAGGLPVLSAAGLRALRPALADSVVSPLDTLDMSLWERTWWGRGGLFRRVGLFPTHPERPTDDLRQIAAVRRRMLRWHQTLGLVTVASMASTVIGGQIAASTGKKGFHEATLPVTIGLYSTTAALALLSPPKPIQLEGRGGIDSITIHRWLAVGHVAGMIVTPLLAEDNQSAHRVMGYATFATFSAAMLTVTLLRH